MKDGGINGDDKESSGIVYSGLYMGCLRSPTSFKEKAGIVALQGAGVQESHSSTRFVSAVISKAV
jgi:hypothetical protein